MTTITEDNARKVLEVVRAGLVAGVGKPIPGEMCVEAAVCFALGEPHGDEPSCVSPTLRTLKVELNDAAWTSNAVRAKGLERLALAQLGSRGVLNEKDFEQRVITMIIKKIVPRALRCASSLMNSVDAAPLLLAATHCEEEGTEKAAARAMEVAAMAAEAMAAKAAAEAMAAKAAAEAAWAAEAAVWAARAGAAWAGARTAHEDETLAFFAEEVVQILIEMKAPGCQWLFLTEE